MRRTARLIALTLIVGCMGHAGPWPHPQREPFFLAGHGRQRSPGDDRAGARGEALVGVGERPAHQRGARRLPRRAHGSIGGNSQLSAQRRTAQTVCDAGFFPRGVGLQVPGRPGFEDQFSPPSSISFPRTRILRASRMVRGTSSSNCSRAIISRSSFPAALATRCKMRGFRNSSAWASCIYSRASITCPSCWDSC